MSNIRTCTFVFWLVAFVGLFALPGEHAGAATAVFQEGVDGYSGTADTSLKGSSPDDNHGGSPLVEWDGDDSGGQNFGLLRFDDIFGSGPGQIPSGAIISSATLTYRVKNSGNDASVNEVVVDWDESVTYNTFGGDAGVQGDEYGSSVGSASGGSGDQTLDVTSSIVDWRADPSANKGWIFRPTGGSDEVEFRSSEHQATSSRPELSVTYIVPTDVEIVPDHIDAVVGTADVEVTVFIPPDSNQSTDVHVTLTTDDANVAVPVGATGDSLVLTFAMGGPTQQDVSIDIGNVGSVTITTTNDAGLGDDTLTVDVTAVAVTFIPPSVTATEGTTRPVQVSISPGSNDTRPVQVTLTTDNAAVAVPAGATGGSLVLTFAMGAPAQQMVDLEIGIAGDASITTTNDGGLDDAVLPVEVTAGFNFTVTCDPRDEIDLWDAVLAAINTNIGGPGVFHVSTGDIDPPQPVRDKIDERFWPSALWYPGIGNHEAEIPSHMEWLRDEYHNDHGARLALKNFTNQDGPASTIETTYTWDQGNARFIMLNEYWDGSSDTGTDGDIVPALYDWLADKLAANTRPVAFVFGHEPAYPFNRHEDDSLNKYEAHRDAFWALLEDECVLAYFCGHTHVYKKHQQNPPDGTWQIDVGNAGNTSSGFPDGQTFANVTVTDTDVIYEIWRNVTGSWQREDTWRVTIPLGMIELSTTAIERTVHYGENLPNDTFTVTAVGPCTLDYTITDNVNWLSVSPDSGRSSGEHDTITVDYATDALGPGNYNATITVSSQEADNSPQTIAVNLTVETVSADFDYDGDVDADDYSAFEACATGPAIPYDPENLPEGCWLTPDDQGITAADFDADEDVDHEDFGVFQRCHSGENNPADPTCAD